MIHPADADEQPISTREVLPPHDRILGQCPPGITRGPALPRDEIDLHAQRPPGDLRIQARIARPLGALGPVEGERVGDDEQGHRHRMSGPLNASA